MVHIEELSPPPHPLAACARLRDLPDLHFLDSARDGTHSYLVADPWEVLHDPDELRARMGAHAEPAREGLPPFQGGAIGRIDYDWSGGAGPHFRFGLYDWAIAWDHVRDRAYLVSTGLPETGAARARRARERAEMVRSRLRDASLPAPRPSPARTFSSNLGAATYVEAVRGILRRMEAGEVEQLNLAHRLTAPCGEDPWDLYVRLRAENPAPFAVFATSGERTLVSASPERFFQLRKGRVECRPIKGTRPRGRDEAEDRRLAEELLGSEKERRENRMVAELLMDELARACRRVELAEFCRLEKHPSVQHLVSVVEGELEDGRDPLDLLRALFPPASIAGRPRRPAMEIIAELEGCERGSYCGSVAWWSFGGDLDANVLIRTFVIEDGLLHLSVGSGIVAGSRPEEEWEETMHKARALLRAAGARA